MRSFSERWNEPCGYSQLLTIAVPMIITTGAISLQQFFDRMFLVWHSSISVGASMTAGILFFTIFCFFMGTVRYANVFVAQYLGGGEDERIGPVVWQSIYLAIIGGAFVTALIPFAGVIFDLIGHEPLELRQEEATYFRIICVSAIPALIASGIDGFFAGQGRTQLIMVVSLIGNGINIILDYLMIFGIGPFPEMGIAGAAWATVIANIVMFLIFVVLFLRKRHEGRFKVRSGWRPNWPLFVRLCRYGVPSGVQFFIDVVGFSSFVLLVGLLGKDALNATTIAFNINALAFMPMIGAGIAVSIMVGQQLGAGNADLAHRATQSGLHLTAIYMGLISLSYWVIPHLYLLPFAQKADPEEFARLTPIAVVLLRFVGIYCLVDGFYIIYSSAVKGAGDTTFTMCVQAVLSGLLLVAPTWIAVQVYNQGLYTLWTILTIYIFVITIVFWWRYKQGKWRTMSVTH